MERLITFVTDHTIRGECQCGRCIDKGKDCPAPEHSVNVHFFWVSAKGEPTKDEFLRLIKEFYPDLDRLRGGPSYIELGGALGSQDTALRFIGLGELVGLWKAITPATFGADETQASQLAGMGMVMAGGSKEI